MAQPPSRLTLSRNPASLVGAAVTTGSALVFVALFLLNISGLLVNPYLGLLVYIALPIAFLLGLLLIPLGIWHERRRFERTGVVKREWPRIDLNDPAQLRAGGLVLLLTGMNVVILSMATYGGVHYMDTVGFCGTVCHTVMQPQYVGHERGPHARLQCVSCHVEPGAASFVQAKLAGAHQLYDVVTRQVPRPIPSTPRTLRPTGDTCKTCHWPPFFHGDDVKVVREYGDDEHNSPTTTTLVLHVGGGGERPGIGGIHWHVATDVEFVATDDSLQTIPYVEVHRASGEIDRFSTSGATPAVKAGGVRRRIDCVDCHNRPSHQFEPTAGAAIDRQLAVGAMPADLPWVRKQTAAALSADYPSRAIAHSGIETRLRAFYRARYPGAAFDDKIARAIAAAQQAYDDNVFPAMKVTWGTYLSNIGHVNAPGCFRCHDGDHKTASGESISQDCDLCHEIR